jgi:hypothetical protein
VTAVERPLRVGELVATTIQFYGERIWAALGIGLVEAGVFVVAGVVHPVIRVAILAIAVTLLLGAATRVVSGDGFGEAWARVAARIPVLAVLAFVVALPFAAGLGVNLFLVVFAVGWLALTVFAVPVAMIEKAPGAASWFDGVVHALRRTVELARAGYLHALGAASVLIAAYLLTAVLLASALVGFAESSGDVAVLLAQLVLSPFFFFGLAFLYYDQRARLAVAAAGASPVS